MRSDKVKDMSEQIKVESIELENILHATVTSYTSELDKIMEKIHDDILMDSNPAILTIEKHFLDLSACLYYMCEKVETLGVYDSISKLKAQQVYNDSYLRHQYEENKYKKKPTVAELTALSEADSLYDKTVNDIYSRAYKTVKNKVSSAETMLATLSKVLTHRIEESKLTTMQTSRQILNEEVVF